MIDPDAENAYPQCEVCYIADNSQWEPESVGDDGSIVSRLVSVTIPIKLSPGSIRSCCDCGELTIAGIYVEKWFDNTVDQEEEEYWGEETSPDPDREDL
jgi:hypothetical protein